MILAPSAGPRPDLRRLPRPRGGRQSRLKFSELPAAVPGCDKDSVLRRLLRESGGITGKRSAKRNSPSVLGENETTDLSRGSEAGVKISLFEASRTSAIGSLRDPGG
jgi:hypothetical protein